MKFRVNKYPGFHWVEVPDEELKGKTLYQVLKLVFQYGRRHQWPVKEGNVIALPIRLGGGNYRVLKEGFQAL